MNALFAAETIIDHAETVLMEKLNEHVLIALTDHIAFLRRTLITVSSSATNF